MTTVFIGGSRSLGRLNDVIRDRLSNIVERGLCVLIGDANGGDRAVQAFLAEKRHPKVVVYCMDSGCRNNVAGWPVQVVDGTGQRGFAYYSLKDARMAREADCGFMIWDGKSQGTLVNMRRLVQAGKLTVVYFSPDRKCRTVKSEADLVELLDDCPREHRGRLFALLEGPQEQATLFRSKSG